MTTSEALFLVKRTCAASALDQDLKKCQPRRILGVRPVWGAASQWKNDPCAAAPREKTQPSSRPTPAT